MSFRYLFTVLVLKKIELIIPVKSMSINSRLMGNLVSFEDAVDFRVFVDSPDDGRLIQAASARKRSSY